MDPQANLEEQIQISKEIEEIYDNGFDTLTENEQWELADLAMRLAELVLAKAEWDRKVGV